MSIKKLLVSAAIVIVTMAITNRVAPLAKIVYGG